MRAIRARYDPYVSCLPRYRVPRFPAWLTPAAPTNRNNPRAASSSSAPSATASTRSAPIPVVRHHAAPFADPTRFAQVEFIIMGGTFMSLPESYRTAFVSQLHNSLSGFNGSDIDEAVTYAEQAKTKCIGITIETRPDYCLRPHLSAMLRYGCTRLEVSCRYEDTGGAQAC